MMADICDAMGQKHTVHSANRHMESAHAFTTSVENGFRPLRI